MKKLIAIARPYYANTEKQRQRNLYKMNKVALKIYEMGHIPVIGVNAALPVVQQMKKENSYNVIMDISLAIVGFCDALLLIAESPGALKEKELILSQNKPVFASVEELKQKIK